MRSFVITQFTNIYKTILNISARINLNLVSLKYSLKLIYQEPLGPNYGSKFPRICDR